LELQRALDQVVAAGVPGAVVLSRRGNHMTLLASGYGNLKQKTDTRTSDRFRVGSVTKTFVATLVLQLVEAGKLHLDDTVESRLPGVIPNGKAITVRQLLNMTSAWGAFIRSSCKSTRSGTRLSWCTTGSNPHPDSMWVRYSIPPPVGTVQAPERALAPHGRHGSVDGFEALGAENYHGQTSQFFGLIRVGRQNSVPPANPADPAA
jgi:CubicO group peptidase (beta-lactamase class C family)